MEKCRLYGIKLFFLFLLFLLLSPETWHFIADIGIPAGESLAQAPSEPKPGVMDNMSPMATVLLTLPALLVLAYICTSWTDAWAPKQIPSRNRKGWLRGLLLF